MMHNDLLLVTKKLSTHTHSDAKGGSAPAACQPTYLTDCFSFSIYLFYLMLFEDLIG